MSSLAWLTHIEKELLNIQELRRPPQGLPYVLRQIDGMVYRALERWHEVFDFAPMVTELAALIGRSPHQTYDAVTRLIHLGICEMQQKGWRGLRVKKPLPVVIL